MSDGDGEPTIAVTGAAGFIGSRVVADLRRAHPEWTVVGLDNFYLGSIREIEGVRVRHVDVRDRGRLEAALEGADVVLHLAAISGVDDCANHAELAYEVNVHGTDNVAWWCRKHGAALVFPCTMGVIGDPQSFPITVDHPRDPLNWYGRTKLLNERAIETFADGAFPAHLFMISNLYGHHRIDDETVTKGTVINFFLRRALAGETLTVYEPGTQSRNYVHVRDVAQAYVDSVERLLDALDADETGVRKFEIASDEDPSVMAVARLVRDVVAEEHGRTPDVELVENPRTDETLVDSFAVDTTRAERELGWVPEYSIEETVRRLVRDETG